MFRATVVVTLRKSILDPQGKAVEHGIQSMGFSQVENVRIGKHIEMTVDAPSAAEAERIAREASGRLLANPVMEDFVVSVERVDG